MSPLHRPACDATDALRASVRATLVIRNGTVLDGTGRRAFRADIAIAGDTIIACGQVGTADCEEEGCEEIDATGLYVAPGFIDIHSHSDCTLLLDPRALSSLMQGVTLEVIGNCGHGCFPIAVPERATRAMYGYQPSLSITWKTAADYFRQLENARPAINVASLVPNGQLRLAVVGLVDRPASRRERARMLGLLDRALADGAWGLSTGLEYPAEVGTTPDEIAALCAVVADADGLYATHTRNRDRGAADAVVEAIATCERTGARLQVSHLLPRSGVEEGRRCVALLEEARRRGLDVAFDMHTRTFGLTYLHAVLPPEILSGGRQDIARALSDPRARETMKRHVGMLGSGEWSKVVILDTPLWPQYAGRDIASIATERGQDALDVVYDFLLSAPDEPHALPVAIDCYDEAQQREVFSHPLCMPASDATALAPDGPLAGTSFAGAYTWAAWFYRFMVREHALLSPEEAVSRLTSVPARRLGLSDRGVIREGARADLVVFDPARYGERGTRLDPNRFAVGVRHVVVNGVLALTNGAPTGLRPGRVLRRAG